MNVTPGRIKCHASLIEVNSHREEANATKGKDESHSSDNEIYREANVF